MRSITLAVTIVLSGCCNCKPPTPPAPLPKSPAQGWKNGTLGEGCAVVKVDTHYELKCKSDKPGKKPLICFVINDALHCE
jgi:hypothetical protein